MSVEAEIVALVDEVITDNPTHPSAEPFGVREAGNTGETGTGWVGKTLSLLPYRPSVPPTSTLIRFMGP